MADCHRLRRREEVAPVKRKKLPVLQRQDRTCGECHACCTVLAIRDLNKPVHETCKHLDASKNDGCTVYDQRPRDCQEYRCAWLSDAGFGDTWHRPDRHGILYTPRDNKWEVAPFAGPTTLIAHETRPGALQEEAAQKFMRHVAGHYIVLAFHGPLVNKARAMGPAGALTAVFDWCKEHGYDGPQGILDGARPTRRP